MNRSLQEYLRCIINGNDTRYTEWSADVKLFPLAYNSQITTTLGMSPYEMVFNQKPRKPIMFTANSHKNAQGYCQPNKDSVCYNLPLHTHDEDHFHHPQILKLASGTHTEWILNRDKKHNEIYQRVTKKLLQRQNINEQINSRFTPASDLKIVTLVLIPNFNTQKGISKKIQPLRKGPYHIIAKPFDVRTIRNCSISKQSIALLPKKVRTTRINSIIFCHRFKNYSKSPTYGKRNK